MYCVDLNFDGSSTREMPEHKKMIRRVCVCGRGWGAFGRGLCVGTLENISDMCGKEGESDELGPAMSHSEMMRARRPRPLIFETEVMATR
jgi:hypothetical protein